MPRTNRKLKTPLSLLCRKAIGISVQSSPSQNMCMLVYNKAAGMIRTSHRALGTCSTTSSQSFQRLSSSKNAVRSRLLSGLYQATNARRPESFSQNCDLVAVRWLRFVRVLFLSN